MRTVNAKEGGISTLLIINQVRGESCCDPGSSQNLEKQLKLVSELRIPASFAFRYDALLSPQMMKEYQTHVSDETEPALFLEIIPQLAEDAGVQYRGDQGYWYKAQSAYLLGYTQQERRQLIDAAMMAFNKRFGFYPKTTVAWMIDAWSLSYLSEQYGVRLHELTRDQWGTDSYTLYGGPMGTGYIPSKSWPLVPAQAQEGNALQTIVVRQTIPDPVWNYGDTTSTTTSQPNDYHRAFRSLSYFESLVKNVLTAQSQSMVMVVGLETSMNNEYQQQYEQQLRWLKQQYKSNPGSFRWLLPREYAQNALQQKPTDLFAVYEGEDILGFNDRVRVMWVSTHTYRARLLINAHGIEVTDLRVYDSSLSDPYISRTLDVPNAYWVVPFLVDGSRFHEESIFNTPQEWWKKFLHPRFLPSQEMFRSGAVRPDVLSVPVSLSFPQPRSVEDIKTSIQPQFLELRYQDKNRQNVTLRFTSDYFVYQGKPSLSWSTNKEKLPGSMFVELIEEKNGDTSRFVPKVKTLPGNEVKLTHPSLNPEAVRSAVSLQNSTIYLHNPLSLQNRNPLRVVAFLRDDQANPTVAKQHPILHCLGDGCGEVAMSQPETSKGEYFFDMQPNHLGKAALSLEVDGEIYPAGSGRVIANCKEDPTSCILHPDQLFWYGVTVVAARFQSQ